MIGMRPKSLNDVKIRSAGEMPVGTDSALRRAIRVRDGQLVIAVEDSGGTGPTCVLLHGCGECSGVWTMFTQSIADDYRCFRVDLCGHGNSSWDPEGRYEPERLAHDVFEVLAALGAESVVLVGHSLGGSVALHLMRLLGQHVMGLVLVDFGPEPCPSAADRVCAEIRETPEQFASVEDYVQWLGERRPLAHRRALYHLAVHALRPTEAGTYEPKMDRVLGEESPHVSPAGTDDVWDLLTTVACPCLVVRGLGSAVLSPQVAERMVQQALPAGTLSTIAGAGHAVMTDNPERFTRAVREFLESLSP